METTPNPRIFVSYAHKDGSQLAYRLSNDLQLQGYEVEKIKPQDLAGAAGPPDEET